MKVKVVVEFKDGRKFTDNSWNTDPVIIANGKDVNEMHTFEDIIRRVDWSYSMGNLSCDCNLKEFLHKEEYGKFPLEEFECGRTMWAQISKITLEADDGRIHVIVRDEND